MTERGPVYRRPETGIFQDCKGGVLAEKQETVMRVARTEDSRDLPLPAYHSAQAAGMDLTAAVREDVTIEPGSVALIPTGLMLAIPAGCEGQVRPRSGLALRYGLGVMNSPGTIDADYRGEVKVILFNFGQESFTVKRGDRIAQLVISTFERVNLHYVSALSESGRGSGGFGSTGT